MVGLLAGGPHRLPRAAGLGAARRSTTRPSSSRRSLPGASAETMASAVTTPLERQFGQIPSLAQMTSVSSFGSSQITLQFNLDRDIDAAEQDVQAAINAASNLLPRTLPTPPTYSKSNPADAPILTLARQLRHAAARPGRRLRRLDPGAEDLAGVGRGPGDAQRRPEAGGARPGRSGGAGRARASASRTCAWRWSPPTSTSPRATSTARARTTLIATNDQLHERRRLRAADHRLQERRAVRLRDVAKVAGRRRERAARRLGRRASARSS